MRDDQIGNHERGGKRHTDARSQGTVRGVADHDIGVLDARRIHRVVDDGAGQRARRARLETDLIDRVRGSRGQGECRIHRGRLLHRKGRACSVAAFDHRGPGPASGQVHIGDRVGRHEARARRRPRGRNRDGDRAGLSVCFMWSEDNRRHNQQGSHEQANEGFRHRAGYLPKKGYYGSMRAR